jgi:CheY-like chemotaxis protein
VISNLLSNAVKFTHEGWIEIRTERRERRLRLTVTDTGVGIDPTSCRRLRQFQQADSRSPASMRARASARSSRIAALHGGDVVAREHGKGSSFVMTVPLGSAHLSPASIVEVADHDLEELHERETLVVLEGGIEQEGVAEYNRAAEERRDATKPTLLYAEDNRDLRSYVSGLLAGDHNVFLASDGEEALDLARRYRPDLVIADQMMPRMSGTDLLKAIRADERLSATPVLILDRAGSARGSRRWRSYDLAAIRQAELRARIGTSCGQGRSGGCGAEPRVGELEPRARRAGRRAGRGDGAAGTA